MIKGLYHRGLNAEDVRQLFFLIDWLVQLPEELEVQFQDEIYQFEEEQKMPYVSSVERMALKKGRIEGRVEGLMESIELDLRIKYGSPGMKLLATIKEIHDIERLRAVLLALKTASDLAEIKRLLR